MQFFQFYLFSVIDFGAMSQFETEVTQLDTLGVMPGTLDRNLILCNRNVKQIVHRYDLKNPERLNKWLCGRPYNSSVGGPD